MNHDELARLRVAIGGNPQADVMIAKALLQILAGEPAPKMLSQYEGDLWLIVWELAVLTSVRSPRWFKLFGGALDRSASGDKSLTRTIRDAEQARQSAGQPANSALERLRREVEGVQVAKLSTDERRSAVRRVMTELEQSPEFARSVEEDLAKASSEASSVSTTEALALAERFGKAGDLERRRELLEFVLRRDPDHPAALTQRGATLIELGRLEEGVRDLARSLELNRENAVAWGLVGHAFLDWKDPKGALDAFRQADHVERTVEVDYVLRSGAGIALARLGQDEAALVDLTAASRLRPRAAEVHREMSNSLRRLERFEEAEQSATRAIELEPASFHNHVLRSLARVGLGDLAGGIEDASRAIELAPEDRRVAAYFNRANLYVMANELERALVDLDERVKLVPDDGHAYLDRADIRRRIGDESGAQHDESIAAKLMGNAE